VKAARARHLVVLARLFGCSVTEVKAMSLREIDAMTDVIEEQHRQMEAEAMKARSARRRS
jgi:DNA-directed RNA polymerase sigma subunit (sigma70/sigma32)